MAINSKNIENSDLKANEILNKVELKNCDDLVPLPSKSDISNNYSNWTCGDGFDVDKACADRRIYSKEYGKGRIKLKDKNGKDTILYICTEKMGVNAYHGKCTPSVVGHLITGGFNWKSTKVGYGYGMSLLLEEEKGFNKIAEGKDINTKNKMADWTKKNAKKGDICVMTEANKPINVSSSNGCGHACIYNGKEWMSDTLQTNALCYGAPTTEYRKVEIWRYKDCKEKK